MSKLRIKNNMYELINNGKEFTVFKEFSVYQYFILIFSWIFIFFIFFGMAWVKGEKFLSIKDTIICGMMTGFIFYLPNFLSALVMTLVRKPILRFNLYGFYYTPQIWSQRRLYEWEAIIKIEVLHKSNARRGDISKTIIYLIDGRSIALNNKIIPFNYHQILAIFRYKLKNISIKVIKK